MKTKLTLVSLLLLFTLPASHACPVWLEGIIKVVDEKNNPIVGAEVWKFYCETDSYSLSKDHWGINYSESTDTIFFKCYTSGGGWDFESEPCKMNAYMFRIKAPGYADVVIKNVEFTGGRPFESVPVLIVTMYNNRYVRKGDYFIRYESYSCNKDIVVKDSVVLLFRDYVEELFTESSVEEAERIHSAGIKTFPNPVKDVLKVELSGDILKPHNAVITDISGKEIQVFEITEAVSTIDISWEEAGMYFISVFDSEGELKYCVRFVKA